MPAMIRNELIKCEIAQGERQNTGGLLPNSKARPSAAFVEWSQKIFDCSSHGVGGALLRKLILAFS